MEKLGRSKVELVCLHASLTRNRFVRAKINGRCARKRRPALPSWNGRSIEPITELSSVAGGVCRFPRQMNGLQSSVHGTSSSAGFERMNVALHADSTNTKGARFFQRFFGYSIWKQYRHFHSNNRQRRFHSPSDFSDRLLPRNSQIFREIRQLCLSRGLENPSYNILLANRTQGERKWERGREFSEPQQDDVYFRLIGASFRFLSRHSGGWYFWQTIDALNVV